MTNRSQTTAARQVKLKKAAYRRALRDAAPRMLLFVELAAAGVNLADKRALQAEAAALLHAINTAEWGKP